jgi:hypothetical protein
MMTLMPERPRSLQSRMFFGLPLRTRITEIEVVGALLLGRRLAQSDGISLPRVARMSMSLAWFMVMTSASRPSTTLRAWLLEPPCDWFNVTSSPAVFFHCAAKDALKSL